MTNHSPEAVVRQMANTVYTLFLFTKSDIKTTLVPIAIGGMVAAPISSFGNFLEEFLWIWLHLLQFTTSNQSGTSTAVAEDADNKPDRPIPSGRMTLHQVRVLRWSLVPVCLAVSYRFSTAVLAASVAVITITIWYNEFGGGGTHWPIRNLLNGLGFGSFQVGATLLASNDRTQLNAVAIQAIFFSIAIYATTTHTQDFKDVEGDAKFNRSTVPLVHPRIARPSVLFGLIAWSLLLAYVWALNAVAAAAMSALGAFVGVRFCTKDGRKNDQISFYWYNVST
ncbi:UbiA prenyltransferase family [Mycena filopes]|nr:UbiA prenyltransferase family [Mycena filopes]